MEEYKLPKKWIDYLVKSPETGMGYQLVNIHFPKEILEKVIIFNSEIFHRNEERLNLADIVKIDVLPGGK